MSVRQENYDEAEANYHAAAACLETTILDLLPEKVQAAYPSASLLYAFGSTNEDGGLELRVTSVRDIEKRVVDEDDGSDENWCSLHESVSDLLDQLIDLDPDFLGDQEFDLIELAGCRGSDPHLRD